MSKSKRLLDLMMTVNRKRKFTVRELADEFGVSARTILRDLQELGELGVPLYSEVGPHGGYQVLNERILPPIAFTEEEAVAIFFASHALRHYQYLPFKEASLSAQHKFYNCMSGDIRDRIDEMKHRIDFVTPARQGEFPYLSILLEAATGSRVIRISYRSKGGETKRYIQPIGLYASDGIWYCPAYCFLREGIRVFRCDRMMSAEYRADAPLPLDLSGIHLETLRDEGRLSGGPEQAELHLKVMLTAEGAQRCEGEPWAARLLVRVPDGAGRLEGGIARRDLHFFAQYIIGLCHEAVVQEPPELVEEIRRILAGLMSKYS
ncbi:helix-turn-helix transcriptional regulator ['Paenibacillus yunnanensis' Narsing Rao et al. 2020]|uniref:helix-turn-helix transcriptional regulator n=1 Tax=Paenibacillus tengchongensis TaxID=2608684 RepID=UPI00124D514F|nr:YafY family protein [Paenibacillus tengchongensis]